MRPDARVWRKHQRDAAKGVPTGRRATHRAETQEPQPGSTWTRRHPGEWPPYLIRKYGGHH
jgi:hypothetical protein